MDFKTGKVWEAKPGYAKVLFDDELDDDLEDDEAGFTTEWLPQVFLFTHGDQEVITLEKDTQVRCLMAANLKDGVILGAIYSDTDNPPAEANADTWVKKFKDGTVLIYDKKAHKLTADVKGDIAITGTGKLDAIISGNTTIKSPNVKIDGKLEVTGDITAGSKISATGEISSDADVKALTVSLVGHMHAVTAAPGTTGPPTP